MTHKALNFLSLARKGGRIQLGEEPVGAVCRSGHARLVILAEDAGGSVTRRAQSFTRHGKAPLITVPFTTGQLGDALGRSACAIAALTDVALAQAFVKALDQPDTHEDLLRDLAIRVERVQKRRQEEKAHKNNVKHGKK